jgi:CRP/FNR family cyclic AMP-dependent transcriptional regulator
MGHLAQSEGFWEDALQYLTRKPIQEFSKRQVIYDFQQRSDRLFLVLGGMVKIARISNEGSDVVARFTVPDSFFGESVLVGERWHAESAVALSHVTAMSWTADEIEAQVERQPRLGLALSQYLTRHCLELQDRIANTATYKTPERVMLALVQLAGLGATMPDGSRRLNSLTHRTIAEYVGTSREIVTTELNRLRRLGMLRYTRTHIDIYAEAIQDALRSQGLGNRGFRHVLVHAAGSHLVGV